MAKKVLAIAALMTGLSGCVSNDYTMMSAGSGISESSLKSHCKGIDCSYDKLKDRVQARANDTNVFLAMGDLEARTIQYTWVSGTNHIMLDLFAVISSGGWSYIESAEVYVGKEMVAKVSSNVDRVVGAYNQMLAEHQVTEIVSGTLTLEQAEKIAQANYEDVTIRFYGKNGYEDRELPREHDLMNVINLMKSS